MLPSVVPPTAGRMQFTQPLFGGIESLARAIPTLNEIPANLLAGPQVGEQLFLFKPRGRRILVDRTRSAGEIKNERMEVVRLLRTRGDRYRLAAMHVPEIMIQLSLRKPDENSAC